MRERDIEPLEPYVNSRTPMWVMGLNAGCGHIWRTKPWLIITRGHSCGRCAAVAPWTHEEIERRFSDKNIELLEPYRGIHEKVLVRGQCGHEWKTKPNLIVNRGHGCPRCGGTGKLTQEEVEQRFKQKGFELLDWYTTNHIKVRTRCCDCDFIWKVVPSAIMSQGTGCPECCEGGGLKNTLPGFLYYARILNPIGGFLYKLGVTNFPSVEKRFKRNELKKITKMWVVGRYETGADAKKEEQRLLGKHFYDRYWGPKILKRGDTELFNVDVLGLDSS